MGFWTTCLTASKAPTLLQSIACMCKTDEIFVYKIMLCLAHKVMLCFYYYAIISVDFATGEAAASSLSNLL